MRVLALTDPNNGVGYHRIMYPCAALPNAECYIRNFWDQEVLDKGVDIVLYNRLIADTPMEIKDKRRQYGFKIIVDVDDYWMLDRGHILYDYYHEPNGLSKKMVDNITLADAVTCTHERLASKIREHNKNVYVIPNALMYDLNQFNADKDPSDKVRLIYVGGVTHKDDVGILRHPMKKIHGDKILRDQIKTVFCGYNTANLESKDAYDYMLGAFTCGLQLNPEIRPPLEVWSYMDFYRNGDISIVPLKDTTFNSMKSNLKILEAGVKHLPVVVSKVHPYLDFPKNIVNYVEKQGDWYLHIKKLVKDKQLREEQGQALGQYCRENYHLHEISKLRRQIFDEVWTRKA